MGYELPDTFLSGMDPEIFLKNVGLQNDPDLLTRLNIILNIDALPDYDSPAAKKQRAEIWKYLPEVWALICSYLLDESAGLEDKVYWLKADIRKLKQAREAFKILHNRKITLRPDRQEKQFKLKKLKK